MVEKSGSGGPIKTPWVPIRTDDGHCIYDADIVADADVLGIMLRAQGNATKEGYWRDVATELVALVDSLKQEQALLLQMLKKLREAATAHAKPPGSS